MKTSSNNKSPKPLWQVIALGILAGMRTTSAPVIASHILSQQKTNRLSGSPLKFMQSNKVAIGTKVLAIGELVGDKLPQTPNRTSMGGIIGRCLSGSLAGAAIYKASGNNAATGALIGSVIAMGSTFGSYYLRKFVVDKTHAFDPFVGAIEDVLVIGSGVALIITA
ncbi:MAG: DUF4126 family protein [Bacteroidota bacterium]|nr:DUF4126 family protein [Bacteroidota bacterium]